MFDEAFATRVDDILKEKSSTTICFFDKGDFYMCFEKQAEFIAKEIFKSLASIKQVPTSDKNNAKIRYIIINKNQFEKIIKELLLFYQYRVELYQCSNNKSQDWRLATEASPGNLASFEDILIDTGNFDSTTVLALKCIQDNDKFTIAVASCDLPMLKFKVAEFCDSQKFCIFESLLIRIAPKECLICSDDVKSIDFESLKAVLNRAGVLITEKKQRDFKSDNIVQDLNRLLKFRRGESQDCAALPQLNLKKASECLSALIKYLKLLEEKTNYGKFKFESIIFGQFLRLDSAAVKALDLFDCGYTSNVENTTLFGVLNKCRTSAGKRLLNEWLRMPLLDLNKINERLEAVEIFVNNDQIRLKLINDFLNKITDLPRLTRVFVKNKAELQHVFKLYITVQQLPAIRNQLQQLGDNPVICSMFIEPLKICIQNFDNYMALVNTTLEIVRKQTSYDVRVKPDYDEKLKELSEQLKKVQNEIRKEYLEMADNLDLEPDKSIKLDSNGQTGYFMRITRKDEKLLRNSIRCKIIDANKAGVHFTTLKMEKLNENYLKLNSEYNESQESIAKEVVSVAGTYLEAIHNLSNVLAILDVILTFAEISINAPIPYVRPKIHEKESRILHLKDARHPILEHQENVSFIPNELYMAKEKCEFIILTGPNMGGKSTYLRQSALIVILAQIGCFVPCSSAEISIIDGIFTRIGASDCMLKGVSTFMAEMIETGFILEAATQHSLIVVDELGRGTSTYDGFGLSFAIAEHIAKNLRAFTLFATHFHEMAILSDLVDSVKNYHVSADVTNNQMTLLYKVESGPCDESFGLRIAEMVDFPKNVIDDARQKLSNYANSMEGNLMLKLKFVLDDPNLLAETKAQKARKILDLLAIC